MESSNAGHHRGLEDGEGLDWGLVMYKGTVVEFGLEG